MNLDELAYGYPGSDAFTLGPLRHEGPDHRPWLILGSTGSGKSTLLRLLAGSLRADAGRIRGGAPADDAAYLPQLPERALAGRNLAEDLCGEVRPPHRRRAELRGALSRVGLSGLALSRRSRRLSAGERRRLALALLLVSGKRHWALDEPEAGLDREGVDRLLAVLAARAETGEGRLWIATHRFEIYAPLRPWAVVLREGRLVAGGELGALCAEPSVAGALSLADRSAFRLWDRLRSKTPGLGSLTDDPSSDHPLDRTRSLLRNRAGLLP